MKIWPAQDAMARFGELLDACLQDGPQIVTRDGAETVGVAPAAEWRGDTNVVSELRRTTPHGGVLAGLQQTTP